MKKRISILSILLLLGMTVYAQTDIPQVIPSLQHWNGAKGKLTLPETGKIHFPRPRAYVFPAEF